MELVGLFTALVTLVTLAIAKPLPSTLETPPIGPEFEVPFGYWEDIVVNGEPWKAFASTSALLLNGRCEPVPFIAHMNHITDLQVKVDEYW